MLSFIAPVLWFIGHPHIALAAVGPAAPEPPERVRVGLVVIDAVVRDRKDRPIKGLRLADFELSIDDRPIPPSSIPVFEEICPASEIDRASTGEPARSGATPGEAGHPGAGQDDPTAGSRIVVFFDFTALSFHSRQLALTNARRYFESGMSPPDQARIVALVNGEVLMFQDMTSDASLLAQGVAALAKDAATVDKELVDEDDHLASVAEHAGGPECLRVAMPFALAEQERARLSLESLREAVASLRGLDGRKSLVLMSDALRLEPGAQYLELCGAMPFMKGIGVHDEVDALVQEAEASGVTLYTVYAGGLGGGKEDLIKYKGKVAMLMSRAMDAGTDSAVGFQATLALQSGGRALKNSNDLSAILRSARQDHLCLYELGYDPGSGLPDGRRHTISLRLSQARLDQLPREIEVRHRPFYVDRAR